MGSSWILLLLSIVLPAVLLANAQGPTTCENTRIAYESVQTVGAVSDAVHSSPISQSGSLCQLDQTCCSSEAENTFKESAVSIHQTQVASSLSGLETCHNHSIFGESASFILQNVEETESTIRAILPAFGLFFTGVFDRFFGYLVDAIDTGNVTNLSAEFYQLFFDVYLTSYHAIPGTPPIPNTASFRQCFYEVFLDDLEARVEDWFLGFNRSFTQLLRYFRALRVVNHVVRRVQNDQGISEQCQEALLRMTRCDQCAGYPDSTSSCNGMCMNTLRGCLVDLGDLVEPIQEFSRALVTFKNQVFTVNSFFQQIPLLQSSIAIVITTGFGSFVDTTSPGIVKLVQRCGLTATRRRRAASGLSEDGALGRSRQANIGTPVGALNDSAHCLQGKLDLFSQLPDTLCSGGGVSIGNNECWNGRQLGNYSRNVVEFPRALQASNPEVCVQYPSKFQRDIRLLQYMTREMNSLTATCSSDDEDCIVPPTTTLYYDLDTIDLMLDVSTGATEMGSGSGSGTDGEGVCQSVVTTPPPTLPTVAVTGGSSITGGPGVGDETPTIDVGVTEVILPGGTGHSSAVCFSGVTRTLSAVLTMMITHLTITEM